MKTYSIRLFPTETQIQQLNELSSIRVEIYNFYLQKNAECYENTKKTPTAYDNHKLVTTEKLNKLHWSKLNAKCIQTTLTKLHDNYISFFVLIKKDKTARPPQPILNDRFKTIVYNQSGWSIKKDNMMEINKIPIRYKSKFDIWNLNIKEIRVKFVNEKWLCDLCVIEESNKPTEKLIQNKILAIDLGIEKLATGVDSHGNVILIHNKPKKISKYFSKQINEIKSKQSKCKKFSKRWKHLQERKKSKYNKKNVQIKQRLHIESKKLINMNYNTIVVGDLRVKKLMQLEENKYKKVSRSFGNSNVSMFLEFLKYKGENAGTNVVKVDESYTTQINCLTGKLFGEKVKLKDRIVELNDDVVIDRDLNSAINIYNRFMNNHLVALTPPLPLEDVLVRNNKKTYKDSPKQLREPSAL